MEANSLAHTAAAAHATSGLLSDLDVTLNRAAAALAAASATAAAITHDNASTGAESAEASASGPLLLHSLPGSTGGVAVVATSLSPIALTVAITIAVVITLVTVVGNLLVVVAFRVEKQLQTASNCILLSLAVADVGLGLISIPLHSTYWIMDYWPLGSVACHVWLCFDYSFTNASVAHLLLICLDRFLSVYSPLTYLSRRTRRRAFVVSALAWAIPFSVWTPLILAGADGTMEAGKCYVEALHSSEVASVVTCMLEFFIPMAIILALYFKIYLIVRQRNVEKKGLHECTGSSGNGSLDARPLVRKPPSDGNAGCVGGSGTGLGSQTPNGCQLQTGTLPRGVIAASGTINGPGNQSPSSRGSEDYSSPGVFRSIIVSLRASVVFRSRSPSGRRDAKAARTLSVILLAFLITWTPYEVFTVIIGFAGSNIIPRIVYESGFALVYLNSTINPICYALGNVNFRSAFIRILKCKCWPSRSRRTFSLRSQRTAASMSCTVEAIPEVPVRYKATTVGFFTASVRQASRKQTVALPAVQLLPQEPPGDAS